jgi:hypothetical protein
VPLPYVLEVNLVEQPLEVGGAFVDVVRQRGDQVMTFTKPFMRRASNVSTYESLAMLTFLIC